VEVEIMMESAEEGLKKSLVRVATREKRERAIEGELSTDTGK
jgi:hypothetical protein